MADADNIGRINIWRNSTIAASAAAAERGTYAFGRMSIYRSEAIARSRRHHEVSGGGGGYTGPLDIQSGAVVAFSSARALSSAKRGSALYTIREDDGDTTQSFSSDASTGLVDATAIAAFLDSAEGFVTTWFDQSGNSHDAVQATAAKQPAWSASGANSRPTCVFDGADDLLATSGNVTLTSAAFTGFFVAKITDAQAVSKTFVAMNERGATDFVADFEMHAEAGGVIQGSADYDSFNAGIGEFATGSGLVGSYVLYVIAAQAGSGVISTNGTSLSVENFDYGSIAVPAMSYPLVVGANDTADTSAWFEGDYSEAILYNTYLSAEDISAISQNIADFYGTLS